MGQEIAIDRFRPADFHRYERRLVQEMALLEELFQQERFSAEPPRMGLELEAWLVDGTGQPQPRNEEFLNRLNSETVVRELAQFNVEFNAHPQPVTGDGFRLMELELTSSWQAAAQTARELDLRLAAIGILPTVEDRHLTEATMSQSPRFRALNEQVLRLRRGRPIQLHIEGKDHLRADHEDVMLEAAATSLQVHLQVPLQDSVRFFNAAMIASAVMVGLCANSPLLFGKQLWAETRIPVFEQSVDIGGPFPRVHFGYGYVLDTWEELFLENRTCHPVLLPMKLEEPVERLPHVRLHNGTIWRWNRPLIGFGEDGTPHLRVEHRVMPAGPTLIDMMANIAFSVGLIHHLANCDPAPEMKLPFRVAFANFMSAAKGGMQAPLTWLGGKTISVQQLVLEKLMPAVEEALSDLQVDQSDSQRLLNVIQQRAVTGQNGADWQTQFANRYGRDMEQLTLAYLERQDSGQPVHEWDL